MDTCTEHVATGHMTAYYICYWMTTVLVTGLIVLALSDSLGMLLYVYSHYTLLPPPYMHWQLELYLLCPIKNSCQSSYNIIMRCTVNPAGLASVLIGTS